MEFEIEHELPGPARTAWELIFSHEFEEELDRQLNKAVREPLSEEMVDGVLVRVIRVEMNEQLPGVLARILGERQLGYILEERLQPDSLLMEWSVIPDKLADRIRASGDYRLVDSSGGCRRIVRGKVEADLPLVGTRFEKLIASELQASYDRGAELVKSWIDGRRE